MSQLIIILGYSVVLGLPETIIFAVAAVLLGFSIHFYWFRRNTAANIPRIFKGESITIDEDDKWRLEFYEQMEQQEQIKQRLEKELKGTKEAEKMLLKELEASRDELSKIALLKDKGSATNQPSEATATKITDLVIAQQNLNEFLSKEMTERLQKAYQEFNFLQDRIQKIESTIIEPQERQLEYEGLRKNSATQTSRRYSSPRKWSSSKNSPMTCNTWPAIIKNWRPSLGASARSKTLCTRPCRRSKKRNRNRNRNRNRRSKKQEQEEEQEK